MSRKPDTKLVTVTMTPDQKKAFDTIPGDKSALIRQLVRDHMKSNQMVEFPPDPPPNYELATTARLAKPIPENK